MRFEFAEQYSIPCVVIEQGDDFENVFEACNEGEAVTQEDGEDVYCVRFPGRPQELYTREALERSFPVPRS